MILRGLGRASYTYGRTIIGLGRMSYTYGRAIIGSGLIIIDYWPEALLVPILDLKLLAKPVY